MPLFGNRVVVGTANVKHIKEFKDDINQRESALAEWELEREKRKEKLEVLQTQIVLSRRNSTISPESPIKNDTEAESSIENSIENSVETVETNDLNSSVPSSPSPEKNAKKQSTDPKCSGCVLL